MRHILRSYTVVVFAFIFAPIAVSFIFSFSENRFPTLPLNQFSTIWYSKVFEEPAFLEAFLRSLFVAGIVAPISTFIGFGAAYIDYRYKFLGQGFYVALGTLPPMIPLVILGVSMLMFLTQLGLSGSLHSVVIAHIVLCMPFAMALNRLRLSQMDPNLEAASWNLGADEWQTMQLIVVPYCLPSILSALFVTAAVSLDEFMIAWFVSGLQETLPVRVLNLVSRQASPSVNAIGSMTFSLSLCLVTLAQLFLVGNFRQSARLRVDSSKQ